METIGSNRLWSYVDGMGDAPQQTKNSQVRASDGHAVGSYLELARKVATLQYRNPNFVLLFRGQSADHRNRMKNTSLKPGLFRPARGVAGNPAQDVLAQRFARLKAAEQALMDGYGAVDASGVTRLKRQRILRWSILQHYEICETPLLDVTHSLRIAASFASASEKPDVFVYVLGVPNLSGSITASAEAGLQIVRLSSVCPPQAVRPHIQEGYLLGQYPDLGDFEQKALYDHYETDFGVRLVAKFRLETGAFWKRSKQFPQVSQKALYPTDKDDPLCKLAGEIVRTIPPPPAA